MLRKNATRRYRVPASGPVTIRHDGQSIPATLKDVSLGGAFFFADMQFRTGSDIQLVLMLPREVGLPNDQTVCCQGKIVRVEKCAGKFGIAAAFVGMERLPQG